MLIWVVFVTSFALVANARVLRDCSTWLWAGLMVQMIAVLAFPPNQCCKILASLKSLYGTCPPFLLPPLQATDSSQTTRWLAQKRSMCMFLATSGGTGLWMFPREFVKPQYLSLRIQVLTVNTPRLMWGPSFSLMPSA
jgi:hypothetical protein